MYQDSCPLFLSPLSLCCLSLLLLAPFLPIADGPSPHGGKKVAKQPPTGRQNSFLPGLMERSPALDLLGSRVCASAQSVAVAREMGIVIGPTHAHSWLWDGTRHLQRRDGKAQQTGHARAACERKCAQSKRLKMTPSGSKVFMFLYKFPFLLI